MTKLYTKLYEHAKSISEGVPGLSEARYLIKTPQCFNETGGEISI